MSVELSIHTINPHQLAKIIGQHLPRVRIVDCRSFLEYNDNHIIEAVNMCSSKLIKRRLQQDKICVKDLLMHCRIDLEETSDLILYDQRSGSADELCPESFMFVLIKKLTLIFNDIHLLAGGFLSFQSKYANLCENKMWKYPGLAALSQPCLPTISTGPTRILQFLYLGSKEDANNADLLQRYNVTWELNVSNKCPKPDFISESRFMRIPVNDSNSEKLLPHFFQAFQFIDKARQANESVLVHCLAGISRSPTIAIAYVMRYLQMTCEDAYRFVKSKRAAISPNFNFLGQLMEHEQQLISENIITKKKTPSSSTSSFDSAPYQTRDFLGFLPSSPTQKKGIVTRKNMSLSIRLGKPSTIPGCSNDPSPTTALSRLQFGKENRADANYEDNLLGRSKFFGFQSLSVRPTRLMKDHKVTSITEESGGWECLSHPLTRESLTLSTSSVEYESKRSSIQYRQTENLNSDVDREDFSEKERVHTIKVDTADESLSELLVPNRNHPSETTTNQKLLSSGMEPVKRDLYRRSDSLSTSGIGSEVSEIDLISSGSWEVGESSIGGDDIVFCDSGSSTHAQKPRKLMLWSNESGHCSLVEHSDASSPLEAKRILETNVTGDSVKANYESERGFVPLKPTKRKTYAEACMTSSQTAPSNSYKRWSLEEEKRPKNGRKEDDSLQRSHENISSVSSSDDPTLAVSTRDKRCGRLWQLPRDIPRERSAMNPEGLYRVQSCPGILNIQEWLNSYEEVPDSPAEPASDSILLRPRGRLQSHCYDSLARLREELIPKHSLGALRNYFPYQDDSLPQGPNKADSSHSSSSTLASSSFSIAVN